MMKVGLLSIVALLVVASSSFAFSPVSPLREPREMTAAQIESSDNEVFKQSLKDIEELMKLFSQREFNEATAKMKSDRGLSVLERAALSKNWKGVTRHMHATHNQKTGEIWHMIAYDNGHGTEMFLWMVSIYDENGVGNPTLFAGGC